MSKIKVGSTEYTISPLRCKHLRKISAMLMEPAGPQTSYSEIAKWMPFILDSVKVEHPDITLEALEEMTIQEFSTAWLAITEISGYKVVPSGETTPGASSGTSSTGDSVQPSAGTTVM